MIEVRGLTKRYGSTLAVDRLSFDVPPGAVTGFLGLNGSGKLAAPRAAFPTSPSRSSPSTGGAASEPSGPLVTARCSVACVNVTELWRILRRHR